MCSINENESFESETDAPDKAIAGVLNQNGRPVVVFFAIVTSV